jgi:hypothetical protein
MGGLRTGCIMHGAAQRSDPAGPGLEGGHAAVLAESGALLRRLGKAAPERLVLELIDLNDRLAALRIAYEDNTAEMYCRELERAAQSPRPAAPRPRRPGQLPLMRVVRGA